jgi:hypothetical protein
MEQQKDLYDENVRQYIRRTRGVEIHKCVHTRNPISREYGPEFNENSRRYVMSI